MGDGTNLAEETVARIVRAVMRESGEADRTVVSTLTPEHELTLSIFSELRYALGTPSSSFGPATQQLPIRITNDGWLEFAEAPPCWASRMIIVKSGGQEETHTIPPGCPPSLRLSPTKSNDVLAVKLSDGRNVRLISFVTYVDQRHGATDSVAAQPPPGVARKRRSKTPVAGPSAASQAESAEQKS